MAEIQPPDPKPTTSSTPPAPEPQKTVDNGMTPEPGANNPANTDNTDNKAEAADQKPMKKPQEPKEPKYDKETGDPWLDMWINAVNDRMERDYKDDKKDFDAKMALYNAQQQAPAAAAPSAAEPKAADPAPAAATMVDKAPEPDMSKPASTKTDPSPDKADVAALDSMDASAKADSTSSKTPVMDADANMSQRGPGFGG